jgi:hypothetical protein
MWRDGGGCGRKQTNITWFDCRCPPVSEVPGRAVNVVSKVKLCFFKQQDRGVHFEQQGTAVYYLDWYSVCIKKFNTQGVLIFSGVGSV